MEQVLMVMVGILAFLFGMYVSKTTRSKSDEEECLDSMIDDMDDMDERIKEKLNENKILEMRKNIEFNIKLTDYMYAEDYPSQELKKQKEFVRYLITRYQSL